MSQSRLVCLIAVALALGFAPAPFPKRDRAAARDDLETMQGVWRMTAQESGGRATPHEFKARIAGGRWTFINTGGGRESDGPSYHFTLDQKVAPRALEWKSSANATSGWLGSYRIEGRKLTIIYNSGTLKEIH